MKAKRAEKTLEQIFKLAGVKNSLGLLRQALCDKCGSIKILEGQCIICAKQRKSWIAFNRARKKMKIPSKWATNPIREEYDRIFLAEIPNRPTETERQRQKQKSLALIVALLELRNCFSKNLSSDYVLPVHNQERLNRILQAIDVLQSGYLNQWTNTYRKNTTMDHLITGDLGTTWHP